MASLNGWGYKKLGCALVLCTLVSGYMYMTLCKDKIRRNTAPIVRYGDYYIRPYSPFFDGGVRTIPDVCIEDHPFHKQADGGEKKKKKKIIVIYNANHDSEQEELLSVSKHSNSKSKGWPVIYKRGAVPASHVTVDHPAYFLGTTCSGNLHHFTTDSLISE